LNGALRPLRSAPVAAQAVAAPVAAQTISLETALNVVMSHLRPNQPEEEKNTCSICMDAAPDTVFTGCGHVCACAGCARRLTGSGMTRQCPICRQRSKTLRIRFA
jgi:hypothetical protein